MRCDTGTKFGVINTGLNCICLFPLKLIPTTYILQVPLPSGQLVTIGWKDVMAIYDADKNAFPKLTKLKREHIFLTSFTKMRCGLATQTFNAILTYCQELRKRATPLSPQLQGLEQFAGLFYGLNQLVTDGKKFSAGSPAVQEVAVKAQQLMLWHSLVRSPLGEKHFISDESFYDTSSFCGGLQLLVGVIDSDPDLRAWRLRGSG